MRYEATEMPDECLERYRFYSGDLWTKGLLIALVAVLVIGCEYYAPIRKRSMLGVNPTTFIFPNSLDSVRETIFRHCRVYGNMNRVFYPLGLVDRNGKQVGFQLTTKDGSWGTARDFYLNHYVKSQPTLSAVYTVRGKPIEILADYSIHLEKVSDSSTTVEVVAICPEYTRGMLSFGDRYLFLKTDTLTSTTVEEYTILRWIGETLGVHDMPALIQPNTES